MNQRPSKDRVYRKVERNIDDNLNYVKGTSVIIHKIRVELGLSLREYVLLDFIFNWHAKNKNPITYGDCWVATGLFNRDVLMDRVFQRLKEKGLLFKDADGKVKTTSKWNDLFNSDSCFDELWKLLNVGNKQKGKAAFAKAIKVDSFENIKAGLLKYIDFVTKTDQFRQHLSTFLNHKNKEWTTEFDASKYQKKSSLEPKGKVNSGPKSNL